MISGNLTGIYANRAFSSPEGAVYACIADIIDLEQRKIPKALRRSMDSYLKLIAGRVAKRMSTAWPGGTGPSSLSQRSGAAAKSVKESVAVREALGDVLGYIGGVWYLKVHEYGATIRPKNGQWLTVPLPNALNSRGLPIKRRARDWRDTFVLRSKRGNLLIFQKRGREIVPLYYLARQVRIPARLGMRQELIRYRNLLFKFAEQDIRREFRI